MNDCPIIQGDYPNRNPNPGSTLSSADHWMWILALVFPRIRVIILTLTLLSLLLRHLTLILGPSDSNPKAELTHSSCAH